MHGFDYVFINVTRGDILARITEATGCVHTKGILSYLNATGSYDSDLFASGKKTFSNVNIISQRQL